MPYALFYHPNIAKDIVRLPKNIKERIQRAIEDRLTTEPFHFGDPLRRSLQGYRKLRIGDYRVIYKVDKDKVAILKIGHRKDVYTKFNIEE